MIVRSDDREIHKMNRKTKTGLLILLLFVLALTIVINANFRSKAEDQGLSKAVFKVA